MKNFFKTVLAVVVGLLITGILFFFLITGMVSGLISSKQEVVTTSPNSILKLTLNLPIIERTQNNPIGSVDLMGIKLAKQDGLKEILENISKAKEDPNISGIYMELSVIQAGISTIKEIRDALVDFKKSNKFIIAYSEYMTQSAYYLASVADKIYLNPLGSIELKGLHSEVIFYKGAMDKLGIEAQAIRHGKYKSAIEPYVSDRMSPENKEQIKELTVSIWQQLIHEIAESRNISTSVIDNVANTLDALNSDNCYKDHLVDSLLYKDQVNTILANYANSISEEPNIIEYSKYSKVPKIYQAKGLAKNKIAIIYAFGDVVSGKEDEGYVSSERISEALKKARKDSSIKAIVLRINSPGGSALASDIIWREVKLTSQVKPVIASMGDMAASGGYYIACAANEIVAQPTTITGSIGVFGLLINGKKLLNNKLGITTDVVKTNNYSDFPSFFREMEQPEKQILQKEIEQIYDTFLCRVSEGRNITKEKVDSYGQGRVWSGVDAMRIHLVDTLGNINDAIRLAAEKANITDYRVVYLPKLLEPLEKLMKQLTENSEIKALEKLSSGFEEAKIFLSIRKMQGIQARIPYNLYIY
jgi:protease-4